MARPHNETKANLAAEAEIADQLIKCIQKMRRVGDRWIKNPVPPYTIDMSLFDGQNIVGFFECKQRTQASDTFLTVYIAAHKIVSAITLAEVMDLPVWFVWRWSDGIVCVQQATYPEFVTWDGNNRGQFGDKEPVGHYSIQSMLKFEMLAGEVVWVK